jgi:methylenetetrahydrofolate dehydrogenase (NADP+)/methenyltetrahydrofolate cyclohydrolase
MLTQPLVLDGKTLAKSMEESLKRRVELVVQKTGTVPVLATILVGSDPASATYVKMKGNACARVGMASKKIELPDATTTSELLDHIDRLNADPAIQGILLQHPVPQHIDERSCFDRIALKKDVDGVTCLGFGRMAMGEKAFGSATPAGIMTLLGSYKIGISGKHAVVVGRSPILGKPLAMMLLGTDATVTVCHSRTKNLPDIVRLADIIVGAVGKPEFIKADWIKPGAVIVDAGYHPGGVGPMTIATLIAQAVEAAERGL